MKVFLLIEKLKQFPMDANVHLFVETNNLDSSYLVDGNLNCIIKEDDKNIHLLSLYEGVNSRMKY